MIFDISMILEYFSILICVMVLLATATNIIVQLIKEAIKIPTNYVAIVIALALTLIVFFAWCDIAKITVLWYYTAGAVGIGLFVAYIAMFGFDKFKQAWNSEALDELKKWISKI